MGQIALSVKILILFLWNLVMPLAAQLASEMLPDDGPSKIVYYILLALIFSPVFGYMMSREFRNMLNDGMKTEGHFNTFQFVQAFGTYLCTAFIGVMGCTQAFYHHIEFPIWLYGVFLGGSGLAISPTIAQFIRK